MKKFLIADFRLPISRHARVAPAFHSKIRKSPIQQAGMALVVTLAILVLLTIAVLAFFVRATANLRVEASRAGQVEAGQLAETALDYTVSRFLREISDPANSTSATNNNIVIFQPKTATNAIPVREVSAAITTTNFFNLVRQSVAAADANASGDSTANASGNGRTVGTNRWNAPALLGGAGFDAADQLPDWIYVNRDGSVTNAISPDAIGRFAYNAYNVGGLLDANAAGYPAYAATRASELKRSAVGADLTQLGIPQTDIDALVAFRNPGASDAATYLDNVHASARTGFLQTKTTSVATGATFTNKRFTGRQDLLRYVRTQNPGLVDALPYLTASSWALNAPGWRPKVNAGSYHYKDDADSPSAVIRNLSNVRVTTVFTRADGTQAAPGEPLLKNRFPLSRLALLNDPATNPADALKYFGLTWDAGNASWVYDHGDPKKVLTLKEVADAGREPDFFELLKAVVLDGSLGRDPGPTTLHINALGVAGRGFDSYSSFPDAQIIQIGANIIDQSDEDFFPTAIYFDQIPDAAGATVSRLLKTAYGIENLPYLLRTINIDYLLPGGGGRLAGWIQPVIWNPHGEPPAIPGPGLMPQKFRLNTHGNIRYTWRQAAQHLGPLLTFSGGSAGQIVFPPGTAQSCYSNPVPLTSANILAAETPAENLVSTDPGVNNAGVFIGSPSDIPDPVWVDPSYSGRRVWNKTVPDPDITFVLEYQDASGTWHPYTHLARIMVAESSAYYNTSGDKNGQAGHTRTDPRTDRFSVSQSVLWGSSGWINHFKTDTLNPGPGVFHSATKVLPNLPGSFFFTPAPLPSTFNPIEFGDLFRNITSGNAYYKDVDGVVRPADGGQANKATGEGCLPYHGGTTQARRPIVLNRPFQSVGELAHAFRDLPFKSLDFSSADSADMGLLDVFCLDEESGVIAGQVNPNAAPSAVLKALLAGATKKEPMGTVAVVSLTDAEADTLATGLATRIASTAPGEGPVLDRADLATALAEIVQGSGTAADQANKNLRETALRALASFSDTRTWNLLIDVVAQAGKLPPNKTGAVAFVVNGERRCWLHVAIDRYTGKVIAQHLEVVYE